MRKGKNVISMLMSNAEHKKQLEKGLREFKDMTVESAAQQKPGGGAEAVRFGANRSLAKMENPELAPRCANVLRGQLPEAWEDLFGAKARVRSGQTSQCCVTVLQQFYSLADCFWHLADNLYDLRSPLWFGRTKTSGRLLALLDQAMKWTRDCSSWTACG